MILPECTLHQATARAEIVRKRIAESCLLPGRGPGDGVTISVGIAAFDETTDRVDLLLKFADDALYKAKRNGRNCVVQASPATELREENFTKENPAAAAAANSL